MKRNSALINRHHYIELCIFWFLKISLSSSMGKINFERIKNNFLGKLKVRKNKKEGKEKFFMEDYNKF